MGRILIVLSFIFAAANALAAQPGNAPIVCVGAPGQQAASACLPLSDLSGTGIHATFSLYAGQTMTSGSYYPLFKNGVAYATGATTKAYCFNASGGGATGGDSVQYVTSQTAFTAGASSIVSGTYWCGSTSTANCIMLGNTANVNSPMPGTATFGDGAHVTYVGIEANNSDRMNVNLLCFEQ